MSTAQGLLSLTANKQMEDCTLGEMNVDNLVAVLGRNCEPFIAAALTQLLSTELSGNPRASASVNLLLHATAPAALKSYRKAVWPADEQRPLLAPAAPSKSAAADTQPQSSAAAAHCRGAASAELHAESRRESCSGVSPSRVVRVQTDTPQPRLGSS